MKSEFSQTHRVSTFPLAVVQVRLLRTSRIHSNNTQHCWPTPVALHVLATLSTNPHIHFKATQVVLVTGRCGQLLDHQPLTFRRREQLWHKRMCTGILLALTILCEAIETHETVDDFIYFNFNFFILIINPTQRNESKQMEVGTR